MRHLARKNNLCGKNETERLLCDIYQESITESRDDLVKFFMDKEFHEKREKYCTNHLHLRLSNLNEFFAANSNSFCVGDTKTYVDYLMFVYLDYVRAFDLKGLEKFPSLNEFRLNFAKIENIQNYLTSKRRPEVYTLPFMKFGNTIETSK
jgi:glutathione S-transferase